MATLAKAATKKARIEIIPLIDVIFFLLATFVLFTLSLNKLQSIPVELPQAIPPRPGQEQPDTLIVQVSDQGTIFWNREPITRADLPNLLNAYKSSKLDPRVLVTGDTKALFGPVVDVLDQVRLAKIEKVSVETRVRDTGK
jgi:biopolymer transport protein ExbD